MGHRRSGSRSSRSSARRSRRTCATASRASGSNPPGRVVRTLHPIDLDEWGSSVFRIALLALVLAVSAAAAATAEAGSAKKPHPFPAVIQLPLGFQPEGIEIGRGTTFYAGSVASGAVYRGDLRTGKGSILVPSAAGRKATGIELDTQNRLWVAGADTGNAYVYDAKTGALLKTYQLGTAPTFINDVVVTRDAAYFTDSSKPVLYKIPLDLGAAQTIPLGGDYAHVANAFNLNGIDATSNGKT